MALARCIKCGMPKGRTRKYVKMVESIGYPETALICGSSGCTNPAMVCLDEKELKEYESGKRIFEPPTASSKFKVK